MNFIQKIYTCLSGVKKKTDKKAQRLPNDVKLQTVRQYCPKEMQNRMEQSK